MAKNLMHRVIIAWGFAEVALFAGQIFGWPSLEFVLRKEGYFASYCLRSVENGTENNTSSIARNSSDATDLDDSCPERDFTFQQIFTLATVITGASLFLTGVLYDRFGTRICRLISIIGSLVSFLTIAFIKPEYSIFTYPSIILLSFAGYYILFTNMQIANLLPAYKCTIIALYTGGFDSSSFGFVLVKFAYEYGNVSLHACFIFIAVLFSCMVIPSTFIFFPKSRIPSPAPPDYSTKMMKRISRCCRKKSDTNHEPEQQRDDENQEVCNKFLDLPKHDLRSKMFSSAPHLNQLQKNELIFGKASSLCDFIDHDLVKEDLAETQSDNLSLYSEYETRNFRRILLNPLLISDVLWVCVQRLRNWFFMSLFHVWITDMSNGDKATVSHFTGIFSVMSIASMFLAPLSGRLMDRVDKNEHNLRIAKIKACIPSFVLDTSVGLLLSIGACIPVLPLQYVTCFLHTVHRALLYGPNSAFIAKVFPAEHFGKLFGLYMTVSALFSFLQIPLFLFVKGVLNNKPFYANLMLVGLQIISYGHPLYMWWHCKKLRQQEKTHLTEQQQPFSNVNGNAHVSEPT
ncbi:equilibrative nucleobase transporter 1-like [Tubulanus polymorphus]|uniref:equilibrative nucleobase transporter 1-like n=1 Tax=Tubulanus polymorphus TaxID=672921 RepID=UPI003DA45CED